jgi:hypothetical protein
MPPTTCIDTHADCSVLCALLTVQAGVYIYFLQGRKYPCSSHSMVTDASFLVPAVRMHAGIIEITYRSDADEIEHP